MAARTDRDRSGREATTITVPENATLLAFTDGLVERRGESLNVGLERLREATVGKGESLDDLLSNIVRELITDHSDDDSALLGVRWQF